MNNPGNLTVGAHGDREILMTRVFDAPRQLVFEAFTKPELVRRWLLGPPGWSMPVCEIDLRVGGKYRYVWRRDNNGTEMGMGGVYREIIVPERVVATEKFGQAWYPGEAVGTIDSREARDAVLKSPMESGVAASYDRLADLLASRAAAQNRPATA